MVGRVGRGMGCILERDGDRRRGMGNYKINVGHPIVTNGNGDALFSNYFVENLLVF